MGITAEEFDKIIDWPNKTPADYKNELRLIRTGVGAFDDGMRNLNRNGLAGLVREQAGSGI